MIAVKTINSDSVYNIRLEYDVIETSVDVESCRKRAAVSFNLLTALFMKRYGVGEVVEVQYGSHIFKTRFSPHVTMGQTNEKSRIQ